MALMRINLDEAFELSRNKKLNLFTTPKKIAIGSPVICSTDKFESICQLGRCVFQGPVRLAKNHPDGIPPGKVATFVHPYNKRKQVSADKLEGN